MLGQLLLGQGLIVRLEVLEPEPAVAPPQLLRVQALRLPSVRVECTHHVCAVRQLVPELEVLSPKRLPEILT